MFWSRGRPGAPWDRGREKATPKLAQTPSCPKGQDGFALSRISGEGYLLWIAHPCWGFGNPPGCASLRPPWSRAKARAGEDAFELTIFGPKNGSQNVNSEFGVLSLWLRHPCHTTVVAHSAYHSYSVYLYVAGGVQAPRGSQRTWIKVGAAKRTPDTCKQTAPDCKRHCWSARSQNHSAWHGTTRQ